MKPFSGLRVLQLFRSPAIASWLALACRIAAALAVFPIVLAALSPAEGAAYLLFGVILSLVGILDFGLNPTFTRHIASARGRQAEVAESTAGAHWAYGRLVAVVAFIFLPVLTFIVRPRLGGLPDTSHAWAAWAACMAALLLSTHANLYIAVLSGNERVVEVRWMETIVSLLSVGTAIAAARTPWPLVAVTTANLGTSALFWCLLRRRTKSLPVVDGADGRAYARRCWPDIWKSGTGVALSLGVAALITVFVGSVVSAVVAGPFLLATRIVQIVGNASQALFYPYLPTFARQLAEGHIIGRALMFRYLGALVVVPLAAAGAQVVFGRILTKANASVGFPDAALWALLVAATYAERAVGMHTQISALQGRINWHVVNALGSCGFVVFAALLWPPLGILALPLGRILAYTFLSYPISVTESRSMLDASWWKFELAGAAGLLLFGMYVWWGAAQ
ncbi:hypothetical protein LZ009_04430 [Ramlibacter sp. XY19]|uniref:hypothetical protein n=1 Tax=Ramlibacter paludis TaxID=2908000 RepID=UPI0023DC04C1|nr:hypothetical protein [Ramlibacter paludis]MCG2592022.1 hypothetical protein [Ramlibacter paludis]